ncbi:MAG TPA: hypothetical protein DC064_08675 [Cyanobacteria bacterium UBA9273]|nr:hypothetical protein [Cyanobacteria bacterium UBA9273]
MNSSMLDYLKVVNPHLHPELVSPLALSRIQALAELLPPFSLAGFECRLSKGESRVDFQVYLPCLTRNLLDRFLVYPLWQAFHQEWVDWISNLSRIVKDIWLEFDLDEQFSQVPIPCIFLNLNQETFNKDFSLREIATGLHLRRLNHPASLLLESKLQLCIDSLPNGARIVHLGIMLSRPTQVLRVVLAGIPPQQLSWYLEQIGWSESKNTLSTLVSTLSEFGDDILLSVDVSDTVHPKIGLEFFWKKQPPHEPGWQLFLDHLVANQICDPAKEKALLAWPGFSQKADRPELWPQNLTGSDLFLGSKAFSVFYRTINHIKLVYQPDRLLEAKGYLAFGHRWLDINALTNGELQKTDDCAQTRLLFSKKTEADVSQYLQQVRSYYEQMNPLILKYVGRTYQAGLLITDSKADPYRETNLYCAAQAGIQPGYHVLDAGCGVCGPSIDIAQNIEGVKIKAITLSPAQASTARDLVQQAGLADTIQVHTGDFHHLPFADEVFDTVFFFESAGYSYNHQKLFAEVYRVLRPEGSLYIKEPFSKEYPLSNQEQQEIAEGNKMYVYKITRMSEMVEAISTVGFQTVISRDLSEVVSTKEFDKAIVEYKQGFPFLTEFGKFHYYPFQRKLTLFGEIKALKPKT